MTATLARPAPATVGTSGVTYVGKRNAGGAVVLLAEFGRPIARLRHVVKHSPSGLEWGYGGSGPADLARSLLIDALGQGAKCPACAGTCRIVWDIGLKDPVPFDAEKHARLPGIEVAVDEVDHAWIDACAECDDGYRPDLPYQDFKFDVVAGFPKAGWTMPRQSVLDWLASHGIDVPA